MQFNLINEKYWYLTPKLILLFHTVYGIYMYYMISYLILSNPLNTIQKNDSSGANQSDFAFG